MNDALAQLAQANGIAPEYHDIWGKAHRASNDTLRTLLAGMGVAAATDERAAAALAAHEQVRWRTRIESLVVVREHALPWHVPLHLPAAIDAATLQVHVVTEAGAEHTAQVLRAVPAGETTIDGQRWCAHEVEIELPLAPGYHRLEFFSGTEVVAQGTLAVAPPACYRPPALHAGGRTFGASVQLYSVRSRRNWGIGDFTDLGEILVRWGAAGGGIVGVNPLHALFPHNPWHTSPYSPSSRLFANTLYLDVEAVADFAECEDARSRVASADFQAELARLREAPLVEYGGVAAAKREILELLYASFRERHLAGRTRRAQRFRAFQQAGGQALRRHALFEALQAHWHAADAAVWGWPVWPEPFRDPDSPEVAAFEEEHADRVDYFAYLQWQADLQREAIAARARRAGLAIGLYTDLAVSIDRAGAEAWTYQDLYATNASVGAPPDSFNVNGQDWGLPPMVPSRVRGAGYAPFIATLRANMRHAGALRIDHVMGLMRLFWVPAGKPPADGAYVQYPLAELMSLLALESHRQQCLIIGEDLGTVPDEVRDALAANDVLSCRVLLFERDSSGGFKPPESYPEQALATVSTHDLPTLSGWWESRDIALRAGLGLAGSDADRDRQFAERAHDRSRLLRALAQSGLLPSEHAGADPADWPEMTPALAQAIASFLAMSPSALTLLQLEDVMLVREQMNLPGTTDQYPNWRRKLPLPVETAFSSEPFTSLAARLAGLRPPAEARRGGTTRASTSRRAQSHARPG